MKTDPAGAVATGLAAEAPELSPVTLELTKRMARLQALVESATANTLSRHSLSRGEYDVVSTLLSTGSPYRLKPGDLSERLLFTTGGISNLLRSLTARGCIDRTPDPDDGRSSWVALTPAGVDTARSVLKDAVAVQTRLLSAASPSALTALIRGLAEILGEVESPTAGGR